MKKLDPGTKVSIGLIGRGAISDRHVKAISRLTEAGIVGAFDVNSKATQAFQARHGIPCFTDVDAMVEKTNPHVLDILTPSGMHAKSVLELIRFKRHFVVEKPLALRLVT